MSRGSPESDFALQGLRAAIQRHPGLTIAALARWLGLPEQTVRRWVSGKAPRQRYIEQLHDFIEGRIAPRRDGKSWTFEPVNLPQQEAARERGKMHQLHAAIGELAAGKASLHVSDGVVAILRDAGEFSSEEDLTERISQTQDNGMNRLRERRPGHRMVLTSLKWYEDDAEKVAQAAKAAGFATTREWIRKVLRTEAEEVLKAG